MLATLTLQTQHNLFGSLGLLGKMKVEFKIDSFITNYISNSKQASKKRRFIKLDLLMEDGLGLTTITRLLAIVTALSLSSKAIFAFLVLRYLVQGVLLAFLALAVCLLCLWNVHLSV